MIRPDVARDADIEALRHSIEDLARTHPGQLVGITIAAPAAVDGDSLIQRLLALLRDSPFATLSIRRLVRPGAVRVLTAEYARAG